jgi:hypothetical protein
MAQVASFAVFHASADPALAQVDVYYDDYEVQLGLPFRQLSFRTDVLAGTSYTISVTPALDTTTVASLRLTPQPDRYYILTLLGVRQPGRFTPNPDGVNTAAKLLAQEVPTLVEDTARVWLAFVHAATDAPTLRLVRATGSPLYGATSYGSSTTGWVPADTLTVELSTLGGTVVARFRGDLHGFAGMGGLLVLSGFVQPASNQNGAGLGLHAVFPDGTVVEFQRVDVQAQTASIQLIHASPDPRLALVDVYINGTKVLDDFGFRSATPLQELPAGTPLVVGIAPSTSQSVADTVRSFRAVLPAGAKLCAIVCGVLSPQNFAPNPNGRPTDLTVVSFPLQEQAPASAVALSVVHAVSDAPALNLSAGTTSLAQGLLYTDTAPYQELPASADTLHGLPTEYLLDLAPHAGKAGVLVVTGFANPAANGNGPGLQPILVFPDGTAIMLSPVTSVADAVPVPPPMVLRLIASEQLWVSVPAAMPVTVELFTLTGERLAAWSLPAHASTAQHTLSLPARLAHGVYLCRIAAPLARQWNFVLISY